MGIDCACKQILRKALNASPDIVIKYTNNYRTKQQKLQDFKAKLENLSSQPKWSTVVITCLEDEGFKLLSQEGPKLFKDTNIRNLIVLYCMPFMSMVVIKCMINMPDIFKDCEGIDNVYFSQFDKLSIVKKKVDTPPASPQLPRPQDANQANDANDANVENIDKEDNNMDVSDEDENLCVICLDAPKQGSFIHSGGDDTAHMCCCMECAKQIMSTTKKCPMCRAAVERIIKTY